MKRFVAALFLMAVVVLSACEDTADSLLPKSGGHPYEVLVVASNRVAGEVVDSILSQDAPCLPQPEPEFDVSLIDSTHFNNVSKLARTVVIVSVEPDVFTTTRIRYDKNVWAKPQIVVYVNTPNVDLLRRYMSKAGSKLVQLLVRSEMNTAIKRLSAGRNLRADSMVFSVSGKRMHVPTDMKSSKKGRRFVWLSNNATSGMTSICVYTYPGLDVSVGRFVEMRDSVMRLNILGERDGMYMTTVHESLSFRMEQVRKRPVTIVSGLWEMRNDAMGGPFVAHLSADSIHRRTVVAEAFVYAPEMKKRNLIRQAEAALYTLE